MSVTFPSETTTGAGASSDGVGATEASAVGDADATTVGLLSEL